MPMVSNFFVLKSCVGQICLVGICPCINKYQQVQLDSTIMDNNWVCSYSYFVSTHQEYQETMEIRYTNSLRYINLMIKDVRMKSVCQYGFCKIRWIHLIQLDLRSKFKILVGNFSHKTIYNSWKCCAKSMSLPLLVRKIGVDVSNFVIRCQNLTLKFWYKIKNWYKSVERYFLCLFCWGAYDADNTFWQINITFVDEKKKKKKKKIGKAHV
eukprot:TRINITY_DN55879_c0_g1_i1.p2 TRINITY_DN55879_c0_g1~~TRINITY_DN55879_c0_g1_i1.p2  ORF type:complete len:211 (-),score=-3.05 TRINITY_DN55879_c0_g1_i1:9-641(-)